MSLGTVLPYLGFVVLLGVWARAVYQGWPAGGLQRTRGRQRGAAPDIIRPAQQATTEPESERLACMADSDAAMGEKLFRARCAQCHTITQDGPNKFGPNLYGLFGRKSGSVPEYNYTKANRDANITWTPKTLYEYLEAPKRYIPGTKMVFAGLKSPGDRADVCAYLIQMTGSHDQEDGN